MLVRVNSQDRKWMWVCSVQMEAEPGHWDGRGRWSEGELDGTWRDRGPERRER